jgi:tetraacyldisaccharide 4'-kinase
MSFSPLILPAAGYRAAITLRNLAYDLFPGLSRALPLPIICVGNLTVGGTGKTPMVARLARHFLNAGRRPVILSRGYGRLQARTPLAVPPGPLGADLDPARLGDEALMFKEMLPQIPLVLDGDRVRGARTAEKRFQADLVLMDDGFQHRRLRRNFNLVMVDGQRLFGNRRLLPAGPLREPLSAFERADAVVVNKSDQLSSDFLKAAGAILARVPAGRIFFAKYRISHFRRPAGGDGDNPNVSLDELRRHPRLCAAAGLANNDYFFAQLKAAGLNLQATAAFGDHHEYRPEELERLAEMAADGLLLTTGKDAVKLVWLARSQGREGFLKRVLVAEIELEIEDEERFFALFTPFTGPAGRKTWRARP